MKRLARRRDLFIVLSGTVFAQALGFAALPLLTRLYSPDAFGSYQLFSSLSLFATTAASLRYESAILVAEDDNEAFHLSVLSIALSLLVALVVWLGLHFAAAVGVPVRKYLGMGVAILPLQCIVSALIQVATHLGLRAQRFKLTSITKVTQSLTFAGTAVGLGGAFRALWGSPLGDWTAVGLMLADALGKLGAAGHYALQVPAVVWRQLRGRFELDTLRRAAYRYRDYPLVALPSIMVNTTGLLVTPMMMLFAFDKATLGQYGLVERSVGIFVSLVAQSAAQVFSANFAADLRNNPPAARGHFSDVLKTQFVWGFVPAIGLMVFGRQLFQLVFGSEWHTAGLLCQISAPLMLVSFVAAPINMTLTILRWQRLQFAWDLGRLLSVSGLWYFIDAWNLSIERAIAGHVIVNGVLYVVFIGFCWFALASLPRTSNKELELASAQLVKPKGEDGG